MRIRGHPQTPGRRISPAPLCPVILNGVKNLDEILRRLYAFILLGVVFFTAPKVEKRLGDTPYILRSFRGRTPLSQRPLRLRLFPLFIKEGDRGSLSLRF